MKYFYLKNRNKEFLILSFIIILSLNFPSPIFYDIISFYNLPLDKNLYISEKLNKEKEILLFEKNLNLSDINKNFEKIKSENYIEYKKVNPDNFIFDKNVFVTSSINNPVHKDKFNEEINVFFEVIKFVYPEFLIIQEKNKIIEKIKNDIKKDIETYYKDQSYINRNDLILLLKKNLSSYFNNGHFIINNELSLFKKNIFYFSYDFDLFYDKDNNIFYYYEKDNRSYLLKVNDEDPKKYIYYKGNNKYFLGYFLPFEYAKENEYLFIKCLFKKEIKKNIGLKEIKEIKLKRMYFDDFSKNKSDSNKNEKIANYEWKRYKNINYIKIRSFDKFFENSLKRFANDAKLLKKEKFLIIDLRDNSGGYLNYIIKWLYNYFREPVAFYYKSISFNNKLLYLLKMNYYKANNNIESYNLNLKRFYNIDKDFFSFEFEENKDYLFRKKNKNYIFIIQNYNTASASEVFINILRNFDNVFLVGTNTKGVMSYGDPALIYLKNTNIFFTIPTKYIEHNLSYNPEGIGILPHLWLTYDFQNEKEEYFVELIQKIIFYEKDL